MMIMMKKMSMMKKMIMMNLDKDGDSVKEVDDGYEYDEKDDKMIIMKKMIMIMMMGMMTKILMIMMNLDEDGDSVDEVAARNETDCA